ncbi:transcription factor Opi1-domain-containing protein [Coprinopsis sp. MPI-PUGE-AT-0042]|nr:transcription factor Opi1-domain-containing protein [Coprinopsis sp. MPI-PUGE-AT-0042]
MDNPKPLSSSLDDQEESVRIAVRALGDMRNASLRSDSSRQPYTQSSLSMASTSQAHLSPSPSSPQRRDSQPDPSPNSPAFVSRMSSFPLVGSALRVYEHGKASSRVVKYGAAMVESSVKTLSRPVINRLPVDVNQLDEFACRQLDRHDFELLITLLLPSERHRESYANPFALLLPTNPSSTRWLTSFAFSWTVIAGYLAGTRLLLLQPSSPSEPSTSERGRTRSRTPITAVSDDASMERSSSGVRLRKGWKEGGEKGVPSWLEANSRSIASSSSHRPRSRSVTPTQKGNDERPSQADARSDPQDEQQIAQRSRWQAVLLEAGGLSAALSEDSMRRLKYCLHWLQYATAHIDAQILILREFSASLQTYPPDAPPHARRPNPISEEHMRKLNEVRKDVIQTVRQVVDVVSKYAGGALPEPARSTVRGFILKLPQKWANKAGVPSASGGAPGERETVAAAAGSATGAAHRRNGNRRAAHRERGTDAGHRSAQSSRAPSPSSPRIARIGLAAAPTIAQIQQQDGSSSSKSPGHVSHGAAMVAAQRILGLATESLDMMRGVTGVVKDSLDRAESWVSRLRSVGLQRNGSEQEGEGSSSRPEDFDINEVVEASGSFHHYSGQNLHHRRHSSSQFSEDLTMSPFFSGASTSTRNSSIPSTPGGPHSNGYHNGASSPTAMVLPPLGLMSLHSRANTPRSMVGELPPDDTEFALGGGVSAVKGGFKGGDANVAIGGPGAVKVIGVDDQVEAAVKMDVDA